MFSTREYIAKKTGPYGIGRFSYLQSLVTEFQDTTSEEAKIEVLGNLANFAYDPINYEYLRQLHVMDLFIDCLSEGKEKMVEFAVGGLCNLCLDEQNKEYILTNDGITLITVSQDKQNKEYILTNDGITLITSCLSSSNEETVLSAITCLMYLVTAESKPEITSLPVVDAMLQFSGSKNPRLSNLAQVFLSDYCTPEQQREALQAQEEWASQEEQDPGESG